MTIKFISFNIYKFQFTKTFAPDYPSLLAPILSFKLRQFPHDINLSWRYYEMQTHIHFNCLQNLLPYYILYFILTAMQKLTRVKSFLIALKLP